MFTVERQMSGAYTPLKINGSIVRVGSNNQCVRLDFAGDYRVRWQEQTSCCGGDSPNPDFSFTEDAPASGGTATPTASFEGQVSNAAALPASVPVGTTMLVLDTTNLSAPLDLTGWIPTGLADGAIISIRKNEDSVHRVLFTDSTGYTYRHVDQKGEALTLTYLQSSNSLKVI